jgi:hypothetical protein
VSLKSDIHSTMSMYPEAVFVTLQACKALSDTEHVAGYSLAKAGKGSEWNSTVNSADRN